MGDRQPIRDRTLILRILVPGLETRLSDKMKEVEESASPPATSSHSQSGSSASVKETLLNLDGVVCEPTSEGSTLWNFHCDGATYPARLVNLPCPIELHKTHDHAMYYKCSDVAQMLIVYEDSMALDEADAFPKIEGYPSYYHSGLTAPLKRVVERKFALREHNAVPPPRAEVTDVEKEIHDLMCKISKEGGKRNKVPSLASAQHANKVLEEIVEEVVDYEPWMDDYGRQASGVEIDAGDQTAALHPEIWLTPEQIDEIKAIERAKEEEALKKKQLSSAKKEKKKKKKKEPELPPAPSQKKGIASKKHEEPVDEVTKAALEFNLDNLDDALDGEGIDELGFDFNDMDGMDF
jgi:transcription initiation factor TFIID subunit 7